MTENRATAEQSEDSNVSPLLIERGPLPGSVTGELSGPDHIVTPRRRRRRRRGVTNHQDLPRPVRFALGAAGVIVGLGIWQLLATAKVLNPLFSSSPQGVAVAFWDQVSAGTLGPQIASTAETFAKGFLIALVVGFLLGILIGWWPALRAILDPFVSLAYAAPRVALVPLIAVWFGIGDESQVVVVVLTAVFPIVINVATGIKATDRNLVEMAQSYSGSNTKILVTVAMPGAVPHFVSGIRQGLSQALIGVVVAEYLIGDNGIGGLIVNSGQNLEAGNVFVGVLIIALSGLVMTSLLRMVERHYDHWRG